jgi:hypothetical protein
MKSLINNYKHKQHKYLTNKDNGNEDYDLFSYGSDPNWDFSNLPFKITWVNPNNGGPYLKFHDGANNLTPIRANLDTDYVINRGNFINYSSFYNYSGLYMSNIANGYIPVSNSGWLQSANTSGKELFFDRGNGRLGIGTTAPAAAISLATSTTVAGGIKFGSDVELYRSAANVLRTPDAFTADGVITGNGSGLTTLNATNLSSGTVANARMSTTPATYTIDPIMPSSTSVIHNTLSDPTSGELGLANDAYTFDFLRYQLPTTISYTLDGNNWIDFNGNEKYATTTTNVFAGTNNGNLLLKNAANNGGTAYQGLRIDLNYPTWNFYVFLKYIYLYTSTNGHQMSIKIERQKDTNATWDTLFQSANTSSWPGHFFISHSSSPFGPTPASGHWQRFRITFTPVWSGSYPSNNIAIYGLRWYATYPASAGGNTARSLFAGDFNRNFQVFSNLQIGAGDANIYRTGVRTLKTDSNVTVENLITTSGNFAGDISMTTTGTKIGWDSGTEYIRRTLGSDGFSIGTQGADRFVVNALGNVGIGTAVPAAKLDVNGSIAISDGANSAGNLGVYFTNDNDTGFYRAGTNEISFVIGGAEKFNVRNNGLQLGSGSATSPNLFRNGDYNTGVYWGGSGTLGISTNGLTRMYFIQDGNVGIGTTTPKTPLDINGSAIIRGDLNVTGSLCDGTNCYRISDLNISTPGGPGGDGVPYTGAIADVNLSPRNLQANNIKADNNFCVGADCQSFIYYDYARGVTVWK